MSESRPNPDALLEKICTDEAQAARGKLKVFFGSSAGVGKTYAMLEEARKRAAEGVDVLIGYAEAHIRPDTEQLLLGLEILPYKMVEYQNATLKEFDLEGALARKPALLCVDELAHTNAPGLRHAKRWQDVEELLNAGINVYTTLNVQHLESVNDIVERITGVTVRETLPDSILEKADEVELIDISPDELVERLREGKIYKPQQAQHALTHFFNRGNLMALRELALRRTAERVDAQMQDFRTANSISKPWAANERIVVAVGPSPFAAQLIRSAKRLANAFRAPWFAVYVDTTTGLSEDAKERLARNLKLARELGAETVTLTGMNFLDELLAFCRQRNITKIVIGKPARARWKDWLKGTIVDEILRQTSQIDVYVIRQEREVAAVQRRAESTPPVHWQAYAWACGISMAATGLGMFVVHVLGNDGKRFSNTNALMIDLLAVLLVATRFGRGPAMLGSLLAVAGFDFTVVPPYYSFSVADSQYLFTFLVMLATALVISTLTDRIKRQSDASRQRERRTLALLALSRDLAATREKRDILRISVRHIAEVFDGPAMLFLPNKKEELSLAASSAEMPPLDEREIGVIRWVFDRKQAAGRGTATLPSAKGLYLPLSVSTGPIGVLGMWEPTRMSQPDQFQQLEAFANQTALAVERATLAEESQRAWERVEAEFLRNTLLSGVSHDLRTPLAAITGAASTLTDSDGLGEEAKRELARNIVLDARRMERLINNLLDITRIESGGFTLRQEWHPVAEIVGSALHQMRARLAGRKVTTRVPQDLPLLKCDGVALEQVLANLLDNAAEYTPAGTAIEIAAEFIGDVMTLTVADRGPGLPAENPDRVFQKFFRGPGSQDNGQRRGIGLGLAICKGIVELHGGTIRAENRAEGGAAFRILLPQKETPPGVPVE